MFGKRVSWLAAACLAAAVLAGGCGDDEGGGAALDVTGHWKSTVTAPGIYMHGPMCLEQTGNAVSGIVAKQVVTGSVAGDTLHMTSGDTGSGDYWTGTATVVAAGRLEGTFEQYVSGALVVSGIVELERYTPSGKFTAAGTANGGTVDVDSATEGTAWIKEAGGELEEIEVYYMSADQTYSLVSFDAAKLTVGTFNIIDVPAAPDEIAVEFHDASLAGSTSGNAMPGLLEVTKFDATGFAATFTLYFDGGAGVVTGGFDVPWDFVVGTPVFRLNVAGHWKVADEVVAALTQTGTSVDGYLTENIVVGTVAGNMATLVVDLGLPTDYVELTVTASSADLLSGTADFYSGGALSDSFTCTMERFTPSGSFSALDSTGTDLVGVDVSTAEYGCGIIDATGTVVDGVEVIYITTDTVVRLRIFDNAAAIDVGTFAVKWSPTPGSNEVDVEVIVATPSGTGSTGGVDGTLVVTKFDATGITGTLDIDYNGDASADFTATFDVPWDIVTGTPFLAGWEPKAPMPAGSRHALTAASLGGKMYVMGGSDLFTPCEEYDPASDTWASMDNVPFQCREAAAASDGTYVYLTGGYDNALGTSVATLYRFDPSAASGSQWTALAPMNQARGMHGAAVLGGKVYVFGGLDSDGSTDTPLASVEAYDIAGGTWDATVTDLPQTLFGLTATTAGGRIYLVGGVPSFAGPISETVYEFDPAGNGGLGSYTAMAPMPTARCVHAAAEAGGRLFVFGGVTDLSASPNASVSVEVYDPATDSWATARDLPDARRLHGSCAIGTVVYVVGGENEVGGGQNYDTNFALDTQ